MSVKNTNKEARPSEEAPTSEGVLGYIPILRRSGLYFTEKRAIVAKKIGISITWIVLYVIWVVVLLLSGLLLWGAWLFGRFVGGYRVLFSLPVLGAVPINMGPVIGTVFFIVIVVTMRHVSARTNAHFERLGRLSPESILMLDKENYEIPYHGITRFEMKKGILTKNYNIRILTKTKEHKFKIAQIGGGIGGEVEGYARLVRSVLPDKTYES